MIGVDGIVCVPDAMPSPKLFSKNKGSLITLECKDYKFSQPQPSFMNHSQTGLNLKRSIGVFGLTCAVINQTIGSGIFVLPALAAELMGAAAIICFFICGLLIFLIGLCFAEVGGKVTDTGGTYSYIETAFGPFAGFLANYIFWFGSGVIADGVIANAISKTLSYFFPVIDSSTIRPLFFLFIFAGLAFVNIRGTKNSIGLIILITFAKLAPLILIILFGISHISMENLRWNTPFAAKDIGATSLLLFYIFMGIETVVSNSGEIKKPTRTIPIGIFSGLSIVLLICVSIQLVTQGILGSEMLKFKDSPLSEVANRIFGLIGVILVTAGIAISMLGGLTGDILSMPRVIFAGARKNILPSFLGKVHPKYFTPYTSIIVYTLLGYILAVVGTLKELVILSTAATLLIYLGVVLAVIRLRYKKTESVDKAFIIPGGLTVPILSAVVILWLLSHLEKAEITGISIVLVALSLGYWVMQWFRGKGLSNVKEDIV